MRKGRPKNSNSFVAIDIKELAEIISSGEVAVSKKFLAACGVDVDNLRGLTTREIVKLNREYTAPKKSKEEESVIEMILT